MKMTTRLLALLLALLMAVSMAACGKKNTTEEPASATSTDTNTEEDTPLKAQQKKMLDNMLALQQENSDVMGWLYVDGTTIDDAVVKVSYNDGNSYYLRRNAKGESDFYGCYFADYHCKTGDRDALSPNTVIFGHSMSEDTEGVKFSQLKKYLKADFARKHPYIYFSTVEDDMVWQIFAVYYANVNFNYIQTDPTVSEFQNIVNKAKSLSIYDYGVNVSDNDKILTLSTCTYKLADGTRLSYPNNYRYVVMAKLVNKDAVLADTATLTVTKNAPSDADVGGVEPDQVTLDPAIYDNAARRADHYSRLPYRQAMLGNNNAG